MSTLLNRSRQLKHPVISPISKGFTLIELLIVVAILVILAAILFPVFSRARESARRSVCQSNLKQIGLALMQYTQDFDERTVIQRQGDSTTQDDGRLFADISKTEMSWGRSIWLYTKTSKILACPSASAHPSAPPSGESGTSYYFNGVLVGRTMAGMAEPVKLIAAQESGTTAQYCYLRPVDFDGTATEQYRAWLNANYSQLHFEGSNYLYMDGHVKFRKQASVCASEYGLNNASCGSTVSSSGVDVPRDSTLVR